MTESKQDVRDYVDQVLSERRTVTAPSNATPPGVDWQVYVDRIFQEHRRGIEVATAEREKAAIVLKEALVETIRTGDENLRQHILHQIEGTRQQIDALNSIFTERDKAVSLAANAAQQASDKAERAINMRLDLMNEVRAQLGDQALTFTRRDAFDVFKEEYLKSQTKMLPRETFDAVVAAWEEWRSRYVAEQRLADENTNKDLIAWRIAHTAEFNQKFNQCLPRSTFEQSSQEWSLWRKTVDDGISRQAGKVAAYTFMAGFVGVAVSVALFFIGH